MKYHFKKFLFLWFYVFWSSKSCFKMKKTIDQEEKVNEEKVFLEKQEENGIIIKPSRKRWVILAIFMYYACVNAFQWIEYCSITPIVVKYYNVSTLSVDWTSIIFMALYPFLVIPASYIIDKKVSRNNFRKYFLIFKACLHISNYHHKIVLFYLR